MRSLCDVGDPFILHHIDFVLPLSIFILNSSYVDEMADKDKKGKFEHSFDTFHYSLKYSPGLIAMYGLIVITMYFCRQQWQCVRLRLDGRLPIWDTVSEEEHNGRDSS